MKNIPQSNNRFTPQQLKILFQRKDFRAIRDNAFGFRQSNPRHPEVLTILGVVHAQSGQHAAATDCFTQLVKVDPRSASAHHNLGIALRQQGEQRKALPRFEKAISLKPDYLDAYNGMISVLHDLNRIDDALKMALKAHAINPDHIETSFNLALCHVGTGEFPAAISIYEKLADLLPGNAEPLYHLSRLHRFAPDDAYMPKLQALLKTAGDNVKNSVLANYALGKACHDMKADDQAFSHWREANTRFRKQIGYHPDEDVKTFDQIRAWADQPRTVEPDPAHAPTPVFILGMPRSGTSLVEQVFAGHSRIHAAGELDYWGKTLSHAAREGTPLDQALLDKMRREYLDELAALKTGRPLITDKNPLNCRWIGVIRTLFPEAPVIHLKRHPMAVCFSNYRNLFRSEAMRYTNDLDDIARYYMQYDALMGLWDEKYGDSIITVDYEEMTENPRQEIAALLTAMGLDWQESCLKIEENKRSVKTTSDTQIRSKIYTKSSEEWVRYEKHLAPLFEKLKPILERDGWI